MFPITPGERIKNLNIHKTRSLNRIYSPKVDGIADSSVLATV